MENKEHWQFIAKGGGQVISSSPEELWNQACNYFKWSDNNPMTAKRTFTGGREAGNKYVVEFNRPYSIKAWCMHCSISERWINDMQQEHGKDSLWYHVIEKILMVIYTQNFEGAMVDLYNPMMVKAVLKMDEPSTVIASVKVEVIASPTGQTLKNSENEVLEKLNFNMLDLEKTKDENL